MERRRGGCQFRNGPSQLFCHPFAPSVDYPIAGKSSMGTSSPSGLRRKRIMSSPPTRVSVIAGVCQQDPERWREFDAIYRPILFAYLRKQGLKELEAEDIISDIYLKLLAKIQTYDRTKCRFRAWLFTVAQNTLVDYLRRRAAFNKAVDGWAEHVLHADVTDSVKREEEFTRIHREKILSHALKVVRAQVSPKVWACFEQRLLRDRPGAAIGQDLGLEPNTVYVHACRVLTKVRAVCEEFDEDISHAFESDVSGTG